MVRYLTRDLVYNIHVHAYVGYHMALFRSCSECTHYINAMVASVIDMYMYMYLRGC